MILARQAPIGGLDGLGVGVIRNAENLIIVFELHFQYLVRDDLQNIEQEIERNLELGVRAA
jgi:hypothetical protein